MTEIPKDHPRYASLVMREQITMGVRRGITSQQGLIAHGRGEAFDYLIGEKTIDSAMHATRAGVAMMLLAKHPIISVNGNVAVLVPAELGQLSEILDAPLEVNIFHRTDERMRNIIAYLLTYCRRILGHKADARIPGISHERAKVDSDGIFIADVVLVPLEDGDRCEALINMGKKVVTIDLNPLSRTSQTATVSIVDNVIRVIPNMTRLTEEMKDMPREELQQIVDEYDNALTLRESIDEINRRLLELSRE